MYTFRDAEEGTQWSRKNTTFIMEDGGVLAMVEQEGHSIYNGRWWSVWRWRTRRHAQAHAHTHNARTREPLLTLPCISKNTE